MGNYSYYYGEEAEQFNFFRLPKKLVRDRQFKSISSDAKILYGVLLDRMSLSMRCGWVDEENRVYIIYTIKDIMEEFECGEKTAIKFLGELCKAGLVEKKRQGQGRPNLLYVKNFNSVTSGEGSARSGNDGAPMQEARGWENTQAGPEEKRDMHPGTGIEEKPEKAPEKTPGKIPEGMPGAEPPDGIFQKSPPNPAGEVYPSQTCTNVQVKNRTNLQVKTCTNVQPKTCKKLQSQTCTDVQPNKTEYTETEYKDIYTSIYPPAGNTMREPGGRKDDGGERLNAAIAFFRENLSFDALLADYPERRPELDGILQILAETYCTSRRTVRIGAEEIPADMARQRLAGLGMQHIQYVLESLKQSSEPIRNVRAYLLTCLYNAALTMGLYYQADSRAPDAAYPGKKKAEKVKPAYTNKFNNFHQRDYDFGELEKQLLSI